jgi:hypothetical protein
VAPVRTMPALRHSQCSSVTSASDSPQNQSHQEFSLGTLFLAAQFLDLLWPALLLLGVERVRIVPGATAVTPLVFEHYPYSHSLTAVLGWAVLVGCVYRLVRRERIGADRMLAQAGEGKGVPSVEEWITLMRGSRD